MKDSPLQTTEPAPYAPSVGLATPLSDFSPIRHK